MQRKLSRRDAADDEKKRAQQEFMREQAARDREQAEGRRRLCTFLRFWHFCADLRCKRARKCAGDVEACFRHFWPHVPEDFKNQIRRAMQLVRDGMPPAQAAVEAREYVAQRKRIDEETQAREAARRAAPPPEQPAPPPRIARRAPPRPAGPRVRGM